MPSDSLSPPTIAGYAHNPTTKPPNWHALVALDVLFNNLASGLYLVAALAELVDPRIFATAAAAAYFLALLFLVADLICLVIDLGDPWRFHHMLRVFKPSSPMSLGTWCLTAFALPLTLLVLISFVPTGSMAMPRIRPLLIIAGLLPAFGVAVYKGVLFSTTAQPGWRDARWLGCYLTNSALLLGCAGLLAIANLASQDKAAATLRPALLLLLVLNAIAIALLLRDVRTVLPRTYTGAPLVLIGAFVVAGGMLAAGALLLLGGAMPTLIAVLLIFIGAIIVRFELVQLPHREASDRARK
jgi:Ni/Fe-hydrogenase subunit HybB-like protein